MRQTGEKVGRQADRWAVGWVGRPSARGREGGRKFDVTYCGAARQPRGRAASQQGRQMASGLNRNLPQH